MGIRIFFGGSTDSEPGEGPGQNIDIEEGRNPVEIENSQEETVIEESSSEKLAEPVVIPIKEIKESGDVVLDTDPFRMNAYGIDCGDLITVYMGEASHVMSVGTNSDDVDRGDMACLFNRKKGRVVLMIKEGSFAEETGIGEKRPINENPGLGWNIKVFQIKVAMYEKAGCLDEYLANNLKKTNDRMNYSDLDDEEFANFRAVSAKGIEESILYRSSSPIDPSNGRNEYAMEAMEQAGIRTVINLEDSEETMQEYDTFSDSYYSDCDIMNPEISEEFSGEEFSHKIREIIHFMTEKEGPYLIHCKEGQDRTGILCALLEGFAGASLEYIDQDYMRTYANYYRIDQEKSAYDLILDNRFHRTLFGLFDIEKLEEEDIQKMSEQYLLSTGLSEDDLAKLRQKLEGE